MVWTPPFPYILNFSKENFPKEGRACVCVCMHARARVCICVFIHIYEMCVYIMPWEC